MLNSSLIGRTVPTGLPCGGSMTIVSVSIEPGITTGLPTICCDLLWSGTGSDDLDGCTTVGSLAPGTALWALLERQGAQDINTGDE